MRTAKLLAKVLAVSLLAMPCVAQLPAATDAPAPKETVLPPRRPQMHFGANALVEVFCSIVSTECVQLLSAVRRLQTEFEERSTEAQIVVFHVGFLDTPTARDPYGEQLSERKQRDYAELLRAKRVGVPQLFVNGVKVPVLLDGASISAATVHALTIPATRKVQLRIERGGEPNSFRVHYKVDGLPLKGRNPLEYLHVLLVRKRLTQKLRVPGKSDPIAIPFTNTVRVLESVRLEGNADDSLELLLPDGVAAEDMRVVAYTQDARTRKVRGSASVDVARSEAAR